MTTPKKILLGVGIAFLLLLIAIIVAVPFLIDVDRHRPRIVAYIEERTGKPTQIGQLTLTIFPTLSIRVDNLVLGNPEGFPEGEFFRAQRIHAVLDRGALRRRQVVITSLEVNDPVINLLSERGKWNFENPPAPAPQPSATEEPEEPAFTFGVIERVSISGGQISAAKLASPTRPGPSYFEAANLSTELNQVNLNAFTNPQSALLAPSPAAGAVVVRSLTLPALIQTAHAQEARPQPAASGNLRADSLRFGSFAVSSVSTGVRMFPREVALDGLNFALYQGRASGDLSFDFSGANPAYAVAAKLTGVNVASLLEAFPEARGKMTGIMDGDITLKGVVTNSPDPLAGATGTGKLIIRDGNIPDLNLNQNLMRLARFTQFGPAEGDPASFSSISADLNIADQRIATQPLTVVGNGVELTAAGSLALAGEGNLAFDGVAKIAAGDNQVSALIANLSGATMEQGKLSLPFTLTGTLEKPNFRLRSATPANALRGIQSLLRGSQTSESTQAPTDAEGQPPSSEPEPTPQRPEDLIKSIPDLFRRR
jgi:AsmA protein